LSARTTKGRRSNEGLKTKDKMTHISLRTLNITVYQ